tara:strand:- start:62 stop:427 length:366 start_codon:yes stop_codon:yes gene_type:complete
MVFYLTFKGGNIKRCKKLFKECKDTIPEAAFKYALSQKTRSKKIKALCDAVLDHNFESASNMLIFLSNEHPTLIEELKTEESWGEKYEKAMNRMKRIRYPTINDINIESILEDVKKKFIKL